MKVTTQIGIAQVIIGAGSMAGLPMIFVVLERAFFDPPGQILGEGVVGVMIGFGLWIATIGLAFYDKREVEK